MTTKRGFVFEVDGSQVPVQFVENGVGSYVPGKYGKIEKYNFTGSGSINARVEVAAGERRRLIGLTLHLNQAPVNTDGLTITIDMAAGTVYDLRMYYRMIFGTDLSWAPVAANIDQLLYEVILLEGDAVVIAYPNADTITYGLQVLMEVI